MFARKFFGFHRIKLNNIICNFHFENETITFGRTRVTFFQDFFRLLENCSSVTYLLEARWVRDFFFLN